MKKSTWLERLVDQRIGSKRAGIACGFIALAFVIVSVVFLDQLRQRSNTPASVADGPNASQ
jgi:hypothetical protein